MFKTDRNAELLPGIASAASGVRFWSMVELEVSWPWFYLQLVEDKGDSLFRTMLMVPSLSYLELVVGAQSEQAWIEQAQLVSPGSVNDSDRWKMETLIEAASIRDTNGQEQAQRFHVEGKRFYTLGSPDKSVRLHPSIIFSAELHSKPLRPEK